MASYFSLAVCQWKEQVRPRMRFGNFVVGAFAAVAHCVGAMALAGSASAVDSFFAGKQVKLLVGADPGGSYDVSARLIARYLGRHIPGNPVILVQNMPGAASIISTNYVFGAA